MQIIEDRVLRFDLDDIRVQVSGGKFYEVDAFVAYRISDPRVLPRRPFRAACELAEQRLRTRLDAALRRVYGLRGFEAALSEERAAMMREVRDQLRPDATSLGLEIEDVRIRRTDLTAEVSQQTYDRMKAERLAEAERLRARGREAAQRIRARADREVVEIVAEARKESEILRGEGEAERNAIFADAFQRDPDFFEFYRSMNAYAHGAAQHRGTTMVLSPDSEFFRFFRDPDGEERRQPQRRSRTAPAARHTCRTGSKASNRPSGRCRTRGDGLVVAHDPKPRVRKDDAPPWACVLSCSKGLVYGGFPRSGEAACRRRCCRCRRTALRIAGLVAIASGVGIVWLVRGITRPVF